MSLVVVVLAAGEGTRMKSSLPKVLHPVAGRPMLDHVLDVARELAPERIVVVVGHEAEAVKGRLDPAVVVCEQTERRGTGHAVKVALDQLGAGAAKAEIVVLSGDTPLIRPETVRSLVEHHRGSGAKVSTLTTELEDPTGYGRVVRDADGSVVAIVEELDADRATRAISEVNAGTYVFAGDRLVHHVAALEPANAKAEYYLTDVIGLSNAAGDRVEGVPADAADVLGVNTQAELAQAEATWRRRLVERWMADGVRMLDPDRVYLDCDVALAPGVTLYPDVHLEAGTRVESGAVVGPNVFARSSVIGERAHVWFAVLREADVGPGCEVGPYASLRPGTMLRAGSKAGTFVEMKKTEVGEGAKVPHLTYLGDTTVGRGANVGAGTVTCNYDGYEKHHTHIGEEAFIGSATMLVAPVTVGDRAITGAGSTITRDVPAGALAVERAQQTEIPGYAARRAARKAVEESEGD